MDKNMVKLRELKLRNFRAFAALDIDFAPLTLLTGANSSGKSSALSAISAVLQGRASRLFPFDFIPNGFNVSLGGFRDLVHGGSARSQFTVGLTLQKGEKTAELEGAYRYSPSGDHILPASIKCGAKDGNSLLELNWDTATSKYLYRYKTNSLVDSDTTTIRNVVSALTRLPNFSTHASGTASASELVKRVKNEIKRARDLQGKWLPLRGKKMAEVRDHLRGVIGARPHIDQTTAVVDDLAEQFAYVGPVRAYPQRYYSLVESGNVGDPSGSLTMQQLAMWKRNKARQFKEVVRLVSELSLVEHVRPSSSADDILKLLVRPTNQKRFINVADVGFGLSQVLPIVVKDVELGARGTLLVNQPEVHLHPSAQAQLANYFVDRLENRRYILETHSEYLINRLRLLVAEKKLSRDQIVIWYFDSDSEGRTQSHRITIAETGNLIGAPKSFFDTYSADAFRLVASGFEEEVDEA